MLDVLISCLYEEGLMKRFNFAGVALLTAVVFIFTAQAQRIRVQGNKFFLGDNQIFMLGANTPWNNWNEFGQNFNYNWWNNHFKAMHDSGLNCTRVWISCSGDNPSPGIDATGKIQEPTSQFWTHLESLFQIAENNEIYLMLALISFDHSKEGNNKATEWRAMYNNAGNRQSFVDNYVIPLLNRFGDNPYFWSIDVGNELDWVHENDGVDISNVFDLVARVANAVHQNSEVLVTLGTGAGPKYLSPTYGKNRYSDAELQKLQPGAYLDFYNNHYYDWMKEWFSTPFENGPSSWEIDEKPCVIGEYAAIGHGAGYSPAECLQKAVALGWQGVMPWTSNGVDDNGSLSNFGSAFKTWSDANHDLVFPPKTVNPGPFTLTINQPQGGSITVSPQKDQYNREEEITLTAVPNEGNELLRWSGDASGTTAQITIKITRNMTVSAFFASAGELVRNGTFDNDATSWSLGKGEGYGNSAASASVVDGRYVVEITNGGTEEWHVQVVQAGMKLEAGRSYVFSFDAGSTAERSMFVAVGEAGGEYTKFFQQTVTITTQVQPFSFEFTASASSDNVRVEFNIGKSTAGLSLDNVSLRFADISPVRYSTDSRQKSRGISCSMQRGILHIKTGITGNTSLEGFSPDGRLVFNWKGTTADGFISIPLKGKVPQVVFLKGAVDNQTRFTQKLIIQK